MSRHDVALDCPSNMLQLVLEHPDLEQILAGDWKLNFYST